jgi:MFS family permease
MAGFLVDRVGARPVLFVALGCFVAAGLALATANGYPGLMLAALLAGVGNSPFHPVDFTILNKRVSQPRLGHAFSVHGISGNLGWAAAPVFMAGITGLTGSWRLAGAAASLWALAVIALLYLQRVAIDDRLGAWAHEGKAAAAGKAPEHPMAFLKLPSVWLCFSFFFWSTCALSAVQSFASPALNKMYGLPLTATAFVVTGFMLCGAAGMAAGGFLASRAERLERIIGACLVGAAALLALAGSGWLPGMAAAVAASLAGFGTGLAGPSRDMLIKRASPPGATGRVYGTVYSGLDLGFALAAPVFGMLLDRGMPNGVFHGAALTLLMGVVSASLVGMRVVRRPGAAGKVPA